MVTRRHEIWLDSYRRVSSTALAAPAVGDVITYTITAENTGNVTLTSVSLSDALTSGGTLTSQAGVTDDNELDVGETWSWTASYTLTQADIDAGSVENVASVTGTTPSSSTITAYSGTHGTASTSSSAPTAGSGVVTTLSRTAALSVTKSASSTALSAPAVGDVITYTITAENTGNVTLHDVAVTDDFRRADDTAKPYRLGRSVP
ncbi:MAG: DUF11 domain-containing protein [Bacteroidetes bacterium]|nr:DUF11 domain-containing protein [Bacteroidota bacterium]